MAAHEQGGASHAGGSRAATHTEIYRRFDGALSPPRPAFGPIYRARLRLTLRKKLPLLLLFAPPWISAVIFSFVVYTKFTIEAGDALPIGGAAGPSGAMVGALAGQLIQVHDQIVMFIKASGMFALVPITWYGAGLICEDRRAGVHLLYFSRPMTRLDYFLAHYATACTFGALVVLAPALLICLIAVVSSPDYSFLTEKWNVILGTVGYGCANAAVLALVVLAVSAVSARKTFALAGVFGVVLGSQALGVTLRELLRDRDWSLFGIMSNFWRLADWLLDSNQSWFRWDPWYTVAVLGGLSLAALAVIAGRLRRMEAVD